MKVVSNSSPLVNLSRIGKLAILQRLYTEILIPEAVYHEIVVRGAGLPGASEISGAEWIITKKVKDLNQLRILCHDLDPGESEAIVLGIQESADLLIMDERMGREMARHMGILYTGTIGVLIEAKHAGIIDQILPLLEALRYKAGFRISDHLFRKVLSTAEELNSEK